MLAVSLHSPNDAPQASGEATFQILIGVKSSERGGECDKMRKDGGRETQEEGKR